MAKFNLYLMLVVLLIFSIFNFVGGNSVSCTFDSDLCGWNIVGTGKFLWKRGSGLTEDRTSGPLNDHTCGNYQGDYIFIAGGDAESNKDIATFESQIFTIDNETNFSFWYIMNGYGTGTLSLSTVIGNTSSELWKKVGRQGKEWTQHSLTLKPGTIKLQFKSTVRIPVGSDLAIDDIQLFSESQSKDTNKSHCQTTTSTTTTTTTTLPTTTTAERMNKTHKISALTTFSSSNPSSSSSSCLKVAGRMEVMPGTCDFEKDTCDIKITANDKNKGVTWERTNQIDGRQDKTDSIFGDHTFEKNTTKGFYLAYRNSWSLFNTKLIASFETPAIYATYACLSFWYTVPTDYSNLKVSIRDYTGRLTPVWEVDNFIPKKKASNRTGWHEERLSLFEDPPFTVVFQAYNNEHYAKVGIDDIKITGANVSTGRTKPVADNTTPVNHTPDSTTISTHTATSSDLTTTAVNHILKNTTREALGTTSSLSTIKPKRSTIIKTTKLQASTKLDTTTLPIPGPSDKGGKKTTVHTTNKPYTTSPCVKLVETTEVMPGSCDFEKDTCGIKIIANDSDTRVTWERTNKMEGNIYQSDRIDGDHTFEKNTTRGVYLVFRNSFNFFANPKQTASVETPAINVTHVCLSFWYNVPSNYSNLKVLIRDHTGKLTPIWSVDNFIPSKKASNMTGWHKQSLSLSEDPPFTVVFQAYNNEHLAKVGIDDISIVGASVSTGRTKPTSDKTTEGTHSFSSTQTSTKLQTTSQPVSHSTIKGGKKTSASYKTTEGTHSFSSTQTSTKLQTISQPVSHSTVKGGKKTSASDKTTMWTNSFSSKQTTKLQTTSQPVSNSTVKGGKKTPAHTTKKPTKIYFEIQDKDKQTGKNKYEKTSTIVGSVVGAILALVLLIVVVYFILHCKTNEKRRRRREETKMQDQHHLNGGMSNGGISNGGFTSGTYFNGSISNEKTKSNGHARNAYDIFTAHSLSTVNTFSLEHKEGNGHVRANGHASPLADSDTYATRL